MELFGARPAKPLGQRSTRLPGHRFTRPLSDRFANLLGDGFTKLAGHGCAKRLGLKLRSSEGAEIAEAALVLPLVFLFLLGIVWFGRAFNIYSTIQQAAQQGALAAARPTCATCAAGTPLAAVDSTVSSVMQASSIDPTQIIAGTASGPCNPSPTYKITVCQQVMLNSTPPPASPPTTCGAPPDPTPAQLCGTLVTFQYPFTFYFPFTSLNLSTITLTAQAQTRTEN